MEVGRCFKKEQGGVYADPLLERIAEFVRGQGVRGVGQSSWGPTLYAVTPNEDGASSLASDLSDRFALTDQELCISRANITGVRVRHLSAVTKEKP